MYKALPKIGISQRTCQACGITLPEGCPLAEKLEHCRSQLHLQHFVQSQQLFNGSEIVPCDIDKQFRHLCLLCCCGVETSKTAEHLASAAHSGQRALACLPPAVSAHPGPLAGQLCASSEHVRGLGGEGTDSPGKQTKLGPALTRYPVLNHPIKVASQPAARQLWERLPIDLLRVIVEASPRPYRCYIQLLSLSHSIRVAIQRTLRELSFVATDPALSDLIRPTPEALAALIGPCKSLRTLSLPIPEGWGDLDEAARGRWLDAMFAGHSQLATLTLLTKIEPVLKLRAFDEPEVVRVLGHLPGLIDLTLRPGYTLSTSLLTALARSCPGLQTLQCCVPYGCHDPDWTALAPLAGTLKQLDIDSYSKVENLAALLSGLTAVTSLSLTAGCPPPATFEPIASHLSYLELHGVCDEDLPGPWLCRLAGLTLGLSGDPDGPFSARLARLLAANQATLRSLHLSLSLPAAEAPALMTALRGLPCLAGLHLGVTSVGCSLAALVPPDLVDRLTRLEVDLKDPTAPATDDYDDDHGFIDHPKATTTPAEADLVHIASARLQWLSLEVKLGPGCGLALALACPALVRLTLGGMPPSCLLSLGCPRLRQLRMPALRLAGMLRSPMAHWTDPDWLLAGDCPRLRVLSGVRLTRPDLLARLGACGSLVRLERLDVTRLRSPLVLRLPGQVEQLRMEITAWDEDPERGPLRVPPVDLCVEAPGLLVFDMNIMAATEIDLTGVISTSTRVRLHNCPQLVFLTLQGCATSTSLQVDEDAGVPVMQPRHISLEGSLEPGCLLGLLARHGSRLSELSLRDGLWGPSKVSRAVWLQLTQALSRLPRLTSLDMPYHSSYLSLACPRLRRLGLHGLSERARVVLACPQLRQLEGVDAPWNLEFAVPAPYLDHTGARW
ncbi:hypothetical protein PAPYR_8986 [Paratrimastix pyriformis]|uniref:Uncharacterized protein n=1 Tax=Paratrimastix pyriformis TaxID=342808 RepID=A0ABQ8UC64_9EUKA|nr:hypothetical protein PAPYR_8986 [Paratrimastix pyriformis]